MFALIALRFLQSMQQRDANGILLQSVDYKKVCGPTYVNVVHYSAQKDWSNANVTEILHAQNSMLLQRERSLKMNAVYYTLPPLVRARQCSLPALLTKMINLHNSLKKLQIRFSILLANHCRNMFYQDQSQLQHWSQIYVHHCRVKKQRMQQQLLNLLANPESTVQIHRAGLVLRS